MIITFGNFQFNCENNILTKNGQIVHLNEKPACILGMFLQEPDKIHSKTDIFDNVWPNRVVTEQVIFQNISYLRAKFGDSSIKTFSRKGYQWQLPLTSIEHSNAQLSEQSSVISTFNTHKETNNNDTKRNRFVLLSFFIFLLTFAMWLLTPNTPSNETKPKNSLIKRVDQDKKTILDAPQYNRLSVQELFESPFATWRKHTTNASQWLIATKLYELEDNVALRFHIQGANRGWHDYILGANSNEALGKLQALSATLTSTNYFTVKSTNAALAELTVIAHKLPDKSLLNRQMIKLNYTLNNLNRANVLTDEALAQQTKKLHKGSTYLSKAQINLWDQNHKVAEQSAEQALAIFKQLNFPHLEAQALIKLSWVNLARQEFRQGVNLLNQAATKAREAKEPLLEFEAHITQSFMASKSGQIELSHAKLGLAKELLTLHQLADIHKIQIYNNASWLAETADEKIKHNEHLLDLPFSPQYERYFYSAASAVRDHYLNQKNWKKANDIFKPWQRNSFQSLSKAHIAFAKNQWNKGIKEAQTAFQYAQVNYHKVDALDAALLLIQHKNQGDISLKVTDYCTFIEQNATNRWRSQNREALKKQTKGNQK